MKLTLTALSAALIALQAAPALAGSLEELEALSASDPAALSRVYDGARAFPGEAAGKAMSQQELKRLMLADLDTLRGVFYARYAPGGWKQEQYGWDLDAEIQRAKDRVAAADAITVKEYQQLVKTVLNSAKDYHLEAFFASNEEDFLPFGLTEAEGRYFITWIDRNFYKEGELPFREGDELVGFNGKTMEQAIAELAASLGMDNVPHSDRALLAETFFSRKANNGFSAPGGPAALKVRRADGSVVEAPLQWLHFKDLVSQQPFAKRAEGGLPLEWTQLMLAGSASSAGPYGNMASRDGFLPPLGEMLWQAPEGSAFRAYIYRNPADGRRVGFVRIPTFHVEDGEKNAAEFAALVERFGAETDALVIDETNNPGGYVLYMYALASMLTDKPLSLPLYRMTMTQQDAFDAAVQLRRQGKAKVQGDADAQKFFGKQTFFGFPADLNFFNWQLQFHKDFTAAWEAGETLSRPLPLMGVREVLPHKTARYTKPLVVLTNEMDMSCGDFFPAMLQDNGRALIFGERTAGAGGSVSMVGYPPNLLGLTQLRMTGTIAVRPNGQPLENLGVTPDLRYAVTAADVQGGYRGYAAALNAALAGLR